MRNEINSKLFQTDRQCQTEITSFQRVKTCLKLLHQSGSTVSRTCITFRVTSVMGKSQIKSHIQITSHQS